MPLPIRPRGFTLLEVLIAVLIFSIGLLGLAGLMVLSVRTNHSAYLRTQATFLAQSMADRIRANSGQTTAYNNDDYGDDLAGSGDCPGDTCSAAALVARDQALWSQQLVDFLPNPKASIQCDGDGGGIRPFNGLCTMIIEWSEADLKREDTSSAPATQRFAWVFQP